MKSFFCFCGFVLLVLLVPGGLSAQESPQAKAPNHADPADPTFQLVFFAVLEGCFQDGLSDADVDQIFLKSPSGDYQHFVAACPICGATKLALQTYRARPDGPDAKNFFLGGKSHGKLCLGGGLTSDLHARLFSDDVKARLSVIHDLEQNWVDRRIASLRLDADEAAQVQKGLKEARLEGMRLMQIFIQEGQLDRLAPAYREGDECAVCNAAVGMSLKLVPRD